MNLLDHSLVADITQIVARSANLHGLSMLLGWTLLAFFVVLEAVRQNVASLEDRTDFGGMAVRVGLSCIGLILYTTVFSFIVNAAFIAENAILSEAQWGQLLLQVSHCFSTFRPSLVMGSLTILFAWLSSFLVILILTVLYWFRYGLLAAFYFLGPAVFGTYPFAPMSHLTTAWFRNVTQLSLWAFVLKLMMRIMLEIQVGTFLADANKYLDILAITGINMALLALVVASVFFTERFLRGEGFGATGAVASSFISTYALGSVGKVKDFAKKETGRVGGNLGEFAKTHPMDRPGITWKDIAFRDLRSRNDSQGNGKGGRP